MMFNRGVRISGGGGGGIPDLGELKLVWLTDSHNITTPTAIRDSAITSALAMANSWAADALIHTGDIGDNQPENVAAAFALLRGTAISCPLITVIGNHDEYEETPGTPNASTIEGASYFDRAAPFYYSGTLQAASGFMARWIAVDNNFYDEQPSNPSVTNPSHSPGERVGHSSDEPAGGSYRQFGATQLNWIASVLAADTDSHMIMMLLHYPPASDNPTDRAAFADVLRADGRPVLALCGHVHPNASVYDFTTTDGRRTYHAYKAPAAMESGAYCRIRVRVGGRNSHVPLMTEMSIHNYTDPGGWTIDGRFTVAS